MSDLKSLEDMESCLGHIRQSPSAEGRVDMIVIRPETNKRLVAEAGELDTELGLVGDNWLTRGDKHTADGSADTGRQLTLMGSRAIAAKLIPRIAGPMRETRSSWISISATTMSHLVRVWQSVKLK